MRASELENVYCIGYVTRQKDDCGNKFFFVNSIKRDSVIIYRRAILLSIIIVGLCTIIYRNLTGKEGGPVKYELLGEGVFE